MNRLNTTKSGKYLMAIIKIYHGDTWRLLWLYCSSSFPVAVIKTLLLRTTQERKGLLSAYWLQSTMEGREGRNSTRNLKQKPGRNTACWLLMLSEMSYKAKDRICTGNSAAHSGPSLPTWIINHDNSPRANLIWAIPQLSLHRWL